MFLGETVSKALVLFESCVVLLILSASAATPIEMTADENGVYRFLTLAEPLKSPYSSSVP